MFPPLSRHLTDETKLIDIWQLFRITALIMLARIMNLLKSGYSSFVERLEELASAKDGVLTENAWPQDHRPETLQDHRGEKAYKQRRAWSEGQYTNKHRRYDGPDIRRDRGGGIIMA